MWGRSKNELERVLGTEVTLAEEPVKKQIDRRRTHEAMILQMFRDGEPVTTTTLRRFSANHTARISGLRHEGHVIKRSYLGHGVFEYIYFGREDEE